MKRKFLWMLALAILSSVMLTACPSSDNATIGGHGTAKITSVGGAGTEGGYGGTMTIRSFALEGVKISRDGAAETAFTLPVYTPTVDLGKNGVTVASNTTVTVIPYGSPDPGLGVLYMLEGDDDGGLFKGTGNDALELQDAGKRVTGLRVNDGVTLTLSLNNDYWNSEGSDGMDLAVISFDSDVDIAGTIKVSSLTTSMTGTTYIDYRQGAIATSRDMGSLEIYAKQIFIRGNGLISTRGLDASVPVTSITGTAPAASKPNDRGGDGGYLYLWADDFIVNEGTIDASGGNGQGTGAGGNAGVYAGHNECQNGPVDTNFFVVQDCWITSIEMYFETDGMFINKGTILGNGGSGSRGGVAAGSWIVADSHIFNTGTITANGGASSNYYGGGANGYEMGFESDYGSVFNSGAITLNGGDGTWGGGYAGEIYFYSGDSSAVGNIVNSGALTANGGSLLANGDGDGANGGNIFFDAYGAVYHSGLVTLNGGSAALAYSNVYDGGDGGYFEATTYAPELWDSNELPVGKVQISGNFVMNGGTGFSGGNGGDIYLTRFQSGANVLSGGGVELLGYVSLDFSGAQGLDMGGDGGEVYVYTHSDHNATDSGNSIYDWWGEYRGDVIPAGPVVNEVDIIATGGNSTGANLMVDKKGIVTGKPEAYADGGSGGYLYIASGADWYNEASGNWVYSIFAPQLSNITNSGKFDLSGGTGGNGGTGGVSGDMYFYARGGNVTNSGELNVVGGSALHGQGNDDGTVTMDAGVDVVNSGVINAAGGSGMYGGMGSGVFMSAGNQVTNSAAINSNGGDGEVTTGNGGVVVMTSALIPTSNTSTIDVAAGVDLESSDSPAAPGYNGFIWFDGVNVTPADGIL